MSHASSFSARLAGSARRSSHRGWVLPLAAAGSLFGSLLALPAFASTLKVPHDYPTIQGAVDAAAPGDEIEVAKGKFCGATISKPLTLTSAKKGGATIIGCASGPVLAGTPLRVGFLLPGAPGGSAASGSKIHGFVFDGKGVSNSNLSPLAFGVFARFVDKVTVEDNKFLGTVQAITNTAGDKWGISDNEIEGLTLFDCTGAFCGGGDGIVIQSASPAIAGPGGSEDPGNRPEANAVVDNQIEGKAPAGFHVFGMDGIVMLGADGTAVVENKTKITAGASGDALAVGILVTNTCCADPNAFSPGSRYAALIQNQDQNSQFGIVVEGSGGTNTLGLILFKNLGTVRVEGAAPAALGTALRAAAVSPSPSSGLRNRFE